MLRCVGNPANPLGHVAHTLYSRPSCWFKHPENDVETKAGPKPEAETETSTRAIECRTRRESQGGRVQGGKRRQHRVHRSVLSLPLWSEIVSCGRASTSYPPPNITISSASQFAEHSSTSGISVPMIGNVLEIEIFAAR
ncbi:uncharacterized protein LOC112552194 [Pogonomyrmex barbatus]|uniref:Uncharacterized protein LOC112552194 n=1 Tax=Pogonomyrmex barbatus TaxID=144034 RepID=A0A8N1S692_9HYME|nr:uncharacterized protein LOC112552194 [Pogonomyrmex barbatus]XP_025073529.1 uncharacterized protein LOC112552194 [Pogonomyrmex barbatus]